jgi:hypothetical protein
MSDILIPFFLYVACLNVFKHRHLNVWWGKHTKLNSKSLEENTFWQQWWGPLKKSMSHKNGNFLRIRAIIGYSNAHWKLPPKGWHSCFEFGQSCSQKSAQRPAILSDLVVLCRTSWKGPWITPQIGERSLSNIDSIVVKVFKKGLLSKELIYFNVRNSV